MLQLSIRQFYFNDLRGAEKSHARLKSRHHSRNVLQSHIYGWPDSFVNCLTSWANQKDLESRSCGSRNWKKFAWLFRLSTIKRVKAIKETTPTHTLGMPLHDCTQPSCCLFVCGDFDKSLCCSLSMITIYKLRSQVLSLGLKCTDRSQWSLAVSGQDLRASVLGSTAIVEYHV